MIIQFYMPKKIRNKWPPQKGEKYLSYTTCNVAIKSIKNLLKPVKIYKDIKQQSIWHVVQMLTRILWGKHSLISFIKGRCYLLTKTSKVVTFTIQGWGGARKITQILLFLVEFAINLWKKFLGTIIKITNIHSS